MMLRLKMYIHSSIMILIVGLIGMNTVQAETVRVDVTYTNPEIVSGPLSFGLRDSGLPSEVNAHFQFDSSELPVSGGETTFPSITSASLTLGDTVLTIAELFITEDDVSVLPNFTIGLDTSNEINVLQYAFAPVFHNTLTEAGGIVLNSSFELNITGTDATDGDFHYRYTTSTQTITQVPETSTISIDIKPGSDPNCFNINGHGVIPVAILGSDVFNVNDIDTETLFFAGLQVRVRGNRGPLCSYEYVNDDDFLDMVCHFEDSPDLWSPGDGVAELSGLLLDGTSFKGTDSICVVNEDPDGGGGGDGGDGCIPPCGGI